MTVKLALSSVPIFQFIPRDLLAKVGGIARFVEKHTGEAILIHDESVPGIYIVGEGRVGVYPPTATRPLVTLGAGESFGEMSFLEKSKASATIRAEERVTKLAVFLQTDMAELVTQDPMIGSCLYQGIALSLSRKLRTTTDKVSRELKTAGGLLQELSHRDNGGELALALLAQEMRDQNVKLFNDVDACLRSTDEMLKRHPDRAASLHELQLTLSDLKSRVRQFYPKLEKQVEMMAGFVKATEDFLVLTMRD